MPAGEKRQPAESYESWQPWQICNIFAAPNAAIADLHPRTRSGERGSGRGHPVAQPIEPMDLTSHPKLIGYGAPFFDQFDGTRAIVG
jgi:hypothetical protein